MITLSSGPVVLRQLGPADNTELAALANNRKIWENLRDLFPHPYGLKDADEFIAHCQMENPVTTFAIEYNHELCGVIGLTLQTDVYRLSAEAGYWLGEPYWSKGIASRALKLLTSYAFDELHLIRLYSGVYDFNKASQRVLEKAGFQLEGIFRKSVIKNDLVLDEYRYAIVK